MTSPKIAIIGGGIVGSTAAYYLSRAGFSVTLFDEGTGQATKAAAGIICPWFTLRRNKPWYFLVSNGAEFYRKMMADLAEDGFHTEAIFQEDGALIIRKNQESLDRDLVQGAIKRELSPSIGELHSVTSSDLPTYFPLLDTPHGATYVQGGGKLDGEALIETLHQAVLKFGGTILHENAQLTLHERQLGIESPNHPHQQYDRILLAVGAWLPHLLTPLGYHVDIRPQKGQLYSIFNPEWQDKHYPVVMPPGKVDIIPFNNGEIVIGASHEDDKGYDLSIDDTQLDELATQANQWISNVSHDVHHRTKVGIRAYTSDASVIVGPVPHLDHVWAVSGLGSSGLTSGPFLGYQWSQLIQTGRWDISQEDFPIERYIKKDM
ncbi:MAG: FAD-dependent oxidoreductase [Aerococcaceae bacterium]|nr:FAD-dependent oxidoreductase [Aerococcaceae bacterium]